MYTYTTPSITCTLTGVDFTSVDYVRIAIKGSRGKRIKVGVHASTLFWKHGKRLRDYSKWDLEHELYA